MEHFLVTLLLLLSLLLSTSFVSGEDYNLSNDYETTEESITVHLKSYKEEVLQCMIQIEKNQTGFYDFYLLYDKYGSNRDTSILKYIGKEDNSCSFVIYQKNYLFKYYFNEYDAFKRKWEIIEKFTCEKSLWNIVNFNQVPEKDGCYRGYNIFFNPKTIIEVMSMTWTSTKIIRKASYDKTTLTVLVQSEELAISSCKLNIGENSIGFNGNDIIYDKESSYSSSAQTGLEFIGLDDNSCSVRIHLDVLNTTNNEDKLLNQDWIITVDASNKNSVYSFYMNSKSWWIDNHCSKVFLRKKFPFSTDVQHF